MWGRGALAWLVMSIVYVRPWCSSLTGYEYCVYVKNTEKVIIIQLRQMSTRWKCAVYSFILQCVPKKWPPLNVWLWQVQTCTALHIIKRAQALMHFDYCHQILYKSIFYFYKMLSKSLVTSSTTCLFPVCSDHLLRKRSTFSFNTICWYFISWTYQADFYWSSCEGKWFVLPVDYAIWGILQERVYRYQIGDVDHLKERLIY